MQASCVVWSERPCAVSLSLMLLHLSLACLAARDTRIALLADQQLCAVVSVKSGSRRSKCVRLCAAETPRLGAAGSSPRSRAPALHCTAHRTRMVSNSSMLATIGPTPPFARLGQHPTCQG